MKVLGPAVKLGIFAVVTIVLTVILGATIANSSVSSAAGYTAMVTDSSGLQVGDDVRMRGVKIGRVTSLEVADNQYAAIAFEVDKSRALPAGVTAVIKYRNLIGQRYLALDAPKPAEPGVLPVGGTIPLERTRPALNLTDLFNGFQPLFQALTPAEVNKLSGEIIAVFQGEGETVTDLLATTASLTGTIADRDRVIGQVITNLNTVIGNVSARSPELTDLLDTLQRLVSGLADDKAAIGSAIESIDDLTRTTAGLVHDARPPLKANIDELGELAELLNKYEGTVEPQLRNWGPKLDKLIPTASYGGWFQYYACIVSGKISIEQLGITVPILPIPGTELSPRCRP
ncbi:MlaD family protein [Pseudonocardia eucalypti]|uniref:MlaD family protein n=1 Tax=Pseudonocardia eucalypti TaxID=648755 RepID=A0ABP9QXZ3_9PSEU|nr:phospholipid/cholesterol/gamma-HCH transport system substrate-binding protein [Pseudonocardia eucalypti]